MRAQSNNSLIATFLYLYKGVTMVPYADLKEWDPLTGSEKAFSPEYVAQMKKIELRNILKSYTGFSDLFVELIQNALDAVDERLALGEKGYEPLIWILIDLSSNTVCVTDNGIGFGPDQFKFFLSPNITFKTGRNFRGSKGVGATYLAYGFNFLQLGTKIPEFVFVGNLERGRDWVDDEKSSVLRPKVKKAKPIHQAFNEIERGSTFCIKLVGENVRPRDLGWLGAKTADQWEIVLRVLTPIGGFYPDKSIPKTICHLEVIDREGNRTTKTINKCEYLYPHEIVNSAINLEELLEQQVKLTKKQKPVSEIPQKYKKLDGIYMTWSTDDLLGQAFSSTNSEETDRNIIKEQEMRVYGFFCYTTKIWDQFNDDIVGLRKKMRILRGGLRLASHNMIQGINQDIPLTRYTGYEAQTHVIVYFKDAEPDLGRKGFQPELVDIAQRIAVNVVNIFRQWKMNLKPDTGVTPELRRDLDVFEWRQKQIEHAQKSPLTIKGKGLFMPTEEIPITSTPLTEQDVVALFNQLLSAGVVRGIRIMATSQHETYDGLFKLEMRKPYIRYIFNKDTNPLGVPKTIFAHGDALSKPYILEYKFNVDALIDDIKREEKGVKDIQLVIAWEMGEGWQAEYRVIPLLHLGYAHQRHIHGCTHIVLEATSSNVAFYAIILSELVRYLQDPDAEQERQGRLYLKE